MTLSLFVFGLQFCLAQTFSTAVQGKDQNVYPMMKDQSYSTIINTNGSKVEMMNTIKNYLIKYELGDSTALSTYEFDENMSEIKLPLTFSEGQSYGKGMKNYSVVYPPVYLQMDAIFAFNNEGQMMLTLTNFSGAVLCFVDDDGNMNLRKESRSIKEYGDLHNEYDEKIVDEISKLVTLNTGIGRFLLAANGNGWENVERARESFIKERREQFKMYNDAIKYGSTELITEESIINYTLPGFRDKFKEYGIEYANNYHSGNWVLGMNQYRWKNDFQDYFNQVFGDFAHLLNGTIESIALDGNIIYEQSDGKVLPVDAKERKKWLKEGRSL